MKKVALVLLMLVMSNLCLIGKATAQTSKSDTTKKKKPAGVAKESDNSPVSKSYYVNTYNAWQAAEALLMFRNKRIQEMQADSIAYVDSLIKLGVELSNNNDEIADLEHELDSVTILAEKYVLADSGGGTLAFPTTKFTAECKKPQPCTDLLTLLTTYPTEEAVAKGDAETLGKILEFNKVISRLEPQTVGEYWGALMDQKDDVLNGDAKKKDRREYKKRLYVIDRTLARLQLRKDYILSRREYWIPFGKEKKFVVDMFKQTKGHEMQ